MSTTTCATGGSLSRSPYLISQFRDELQALCLGECIPAYPVEDRVSLQQRGRLVSRHVLDSGLRQQHVGSVGQAGDRERAGVAGVAPVTGWHGLYPDVPPRAY